MSDSKLHISSSPHFSAGLSTQLIMGFVLLALLPECIAGVVFFGWKALVTILVSVVSCVVFEWLFQLITKQKIVISNLSACVTGVLLALVCPPTIPVWMIVIGDAIAIVVAKGLFGGIGSNVFNPALTGRAFLFISFPAAMGAKWIIPGIDGISSATVLSEIQKGAVNASNFDFINFFVGNRAGCIGETSILLLLISFIFLLAFKIIDWRASLAMVCTVMVCAFINGIAAYGNFVLALKEVCMYLLTGGLIFGATFMVTDYATAPVTKPGRLVFGFGCGLITFLIRRFGGYPEGVMFSILIMNSIAPFLNNLTVRMYGYGKKGHRRVDINEIAQEFDLSTAKPRNLSKEDK